MAKRPIKDAVVTVRLETALLERGQNLQDAVGISVAEQMRRAYVEWLDRHEKRLLGRSR